MGAEQSREPEGEEEQQSRLREIARMDQVVRKRVRSGVQYNMKIILRGERGTGKTTLWKRFQGMQYVDKYLPTPEIQSTTINWNFHNGEDNVKVDVWDVVDRAIKPKGATARHDQQGHHSGRNNFELLDASVVDVYRDTSAVIFLVNPRAPSSLDYIRTMATEVPLHVSILVLLNFRDLCTGAKEEVSMEDVLALCDEIRSKRVEQALNNSSVNARNPSNDASDDEGNGNDALRQVLSGVDDPLDTDAFALEASLLNCFGLAELNQYLDIPFLKLKQRALREQQLRVASDLHDSTASLVQNLSSLNYESFAAAYNQRLQQKQQREVANATLASDSADDVLNGHSTNKISAQHRADAHHSSSDSDDPHSNKVSQKLRQSVQRHSDQQQQQLQEGDINGGSLRSTVSLKLTHTSQDEKEAHKGTKHKKGDVAVTENGHNSGPKTTGKKKDKKAESSSTNDTPSEPLRTKTAFEAEVEAFKPTVSSSRPGVAGDDTLEGFLEPSDEDERTARKHKDKVRAYLMTRSTSSDRGVSKTGEDEDEEEEEYMPMARSGGNKTKLSGLKKNKEANGKKASVDSHHTKKAKETKRAPQTMRWEDSEGDSNDEDSEAPLRSKMGSSQSQSKPTQSSLRRATGGGGLKATTPTSASAITPTTAQSVSSFSLATKNDAKSPQSAHDAFLPPQKQPEPLLKSNTGDSQRVRSAPPSMAFTAPSGSNDLLPSVSMNMRSDSEEYTPSASTATPGSASSTLWTPHHQQLQRKNANGAPLNLSALDAFLDDSDSDDQGAGSTSKLVPLQSHASNPPRPVVVQSDGSDFEVPVVETKEKKEKKDKKKDKKKEKEKKEDKKEGKKEGKSHASSSTPTGAATVSSAHNISSKREKEEEGVRKSKSKDKTVKTSNQFDNGTDDDSDDVALMRRPIGGLKKKVAGVSPSTHSSNSLSNLPAEVDL